MRERGEGEREREKEREGGMKRENENTHSLVSTKICSVSKLLRAMIHTDEKANYTVYIFSGSL